MRRPFAAPFVVPRGPLLVAAALAFASGCELLGDIDDRTLAEPAAATASGTGGAGGAGGSGGADSSGGGGSAPRCPDGPYGPDALYFGEPVIWAGADASKGFGHLAPSGQRFVKSAGTVTDAEGCIGTCFKLEELSRTDADGEWSAPASFLVSYVGDWPHIAMNDLALFACHGGELKCAYYRRGMITDSFPFDTTHNFWENPEFGTMKANGGAADHAFTPTPDGGVIVFASDRAGPSDDAASGSGQLDLWTATLKVPGDPEQGYQNLVKHPVASSPTQNDTPSWLSDDARTVVLSAQWPSDTTSDLYLASRATADGELGAPVKLSGLSRDNVVEEGFSLPSLAALAAQGNVGEGIVRWSTSTSQREFRKFAVCLGSPDP
jgi:hypothetical protein